MGINTSRPADRLKKTEALIASINGKISQQQAKLTEVQDRRGAADALRIKIEDAQKVKASRIATIGLELNKVPDVGRERIDLLAELKTLTESKIPEEAELAELDKLGYATPMIEVIKGLEAERQPIIEVKDAQQAALDKKTAAYPERLSAHLGRCAQNGFEDSLKRTKATVKGLRPKAEEPVVVAEPVV